MSDAPRLSGSAPNSPRQGRRDARDLNSRLDTMERNVSLMSASLQQVLAALNTLQPPSPGDAGNASQPISGPPVGLSFRPDATPAEVKEFFLNRKHFVCSGPKLSGLDSTVHYTFVYDWRLRVQHAIAAAGTSLEWVKVQLASLMLEGEALAWFSSLTALPPSLDEFFGMVEQRYQPVNAQRQASLDFERDMMQAGEPAEAFLNRLRKLAGIAKLPESVLLFKFQSSLSPALRSELEKRFSTTGVETPTLSQIAREAAEIQRLALLTGQQPSTANPTNSSKPPSRQAKLASITAEDIISSKDMLVEVINAIATGPRLLEDLGITKEQLEYRKSKRLCFACGKPRHNYLQCRTLKHKDRYKDNKDLKDQGQ